MDGDVDWVHWLSRGDAVARERAFGTLLEQRSECFAGKRRQENPPGHEVHAPGQPAGS